MARSCIFCSSPGPLSNEHIFPMWLLNELRSRGLAPEGDQRARFEVVDDYASVIGVASSEKPLSPHGVMVSRAVCLDCNNGWMGKGLERDFSLLFRMIVNGTLSEAPQPETFVLIARWVVKTAMVFDASIGKGLYYSQADREALMRGAVPDDTDVRMAVLSTAGTSVDSAAMHMGFTNNGEPILGSIEVVYAGPLAFMVRRSSSGQHLLRLLAATEHFAGDWIGIQDVLPGSTYTRVVSQPEVEAFLNNPWAVEEV